MTPFVLVNRRVAQLEELTFKQQMAIYAESQIVIMTHGAALGNVLFMSSVSHMLSKELSWFNCALLHALHCTVYERLGT